MDTSSSNTRTLLVFAGGAVIGGAVAFGAAYGLATAYTRQQEERSSKQRTVKDGRDRGAPRASAVMPVSSLAKGSRPAASSQLNGGPAGATPPSAAAGRAALPPRVPVTAVPTPAQAQRAHGQAPAGPSALEAVHRPQVSPMMSYLSQVDGGDDGGYTVKPDGRISDGEVLANGHTESADGRRLTSASLGDFRASTNGVPNGHVASPAVPSGRVADSKQGSPSKLPPGARATSPAGAMAVVPWAAYVGLPPASPSLVDGGKMNGELVAHAAAGAVVAAPGAAGAVAVPAAASMLGASGAAHSEEYSRVITPETAVTDEMEDVCTMLVETLDMRKKWLFKPGVTPDMRRYEPEATVPSDIVRDPMAYVPLPASGHTWRMVDGVMQVYAPGAGPDAGGATLFQVPGSASDFFTDMHRILRYAASGPVKSFCHHRLMLLEQKFNLHVMLNADKEFLAQKAAPHRDFYNVRKVDTHIHHSACMHQKHLLRFIKSKLRKEPDEVVIFRDGKYLTLREVFESLKLTGYDLNVDTLDMHADKNTFHRFDKFNLKYNPCGQSRLREIFIKQDNLIHGRFLAELTKEVFSDLESSKYQHAEMRISIYGRKAMEWDILAAWVVGFQLYSDNNVWLIQIPRLYNVYKETGVIENFQQMLDNIFEPLFEVTADPSTHPQLHVMLSQVVGFDMVDDESKPERRPTKHSPPPADWNSKHNCAYAYYCYYIYANLYVLNKFREARGLNTFTFRPHAGEAGDVDHLVCTFLSAENIAHGINLRKSPCLQYLYYLSQIGLCMSPLSNNSLFLDYHRNPFPVFFARGLSVSLSTDDPLQIHLTKEPLVEEYSVAAQVFKMSSADLCEIARNGVLHSGFPHACKKHWVAEEYWRPGPEGNDIHKTNVPNLRLRFRYDTYCDEVRQVLHCANSAQARKALQNKGGAE